MLSFPEGLFLTCSYDFLSEDWNSKSYVLYAFINNYVLPLLLVIFFYSQIVRAVVVHEAALKAQAKKMNVDSLRSNTVRNSFNVTDIVHKSKFFQSFQDENAESAEMKIAKVAITNVLLWVCIWTPYAFVSMLGCFGNKALITPLISQLPSFGAKTASCLNPIVFAVSHPKYREVLAEKCACLGIGQKGANTDTDTKMQTMKSDGA